MDVPKNTKYRKLFRVRLTENKLSERGSQLAFGEFGLKAMTPFIIYKKQIEAMRQTIMRAIKRQGQLIIRVFAKYQTTRKPAEVRMGGGKGAVDHDLWCDKVYPGKIMFELKGVSREAAEHAFQLAKYKTGIECKFIDRSGKGEL